MIAALAFVQNLQDESLSGFKGCMEIGILRVTILCWPSVG